MTNKLEKQFFDTFGIEAKYESHSCDGWGRTVEVKYFTDKKEAAKFGIVVSELEYPQITDRILLELICILTRWHLDEREPYEIMSINTEQLKNQILSNSLYIAKSAKAKHLVRALFGENND